MNDRTTVFCAESGSGPVFVLVGGGDVYGRPGTFFDVLISFSYNVDGVLLVLVMKNSRTVKVTSAVILTPYFVGSS